MTERISAECLAWATKTTLPSVVDSIEGRITSVVACRRIASSIWRAERSHDAFPVGGLNSELSTRERLQTIGMELEGLASLPDVIALQSMAISWSKDDPLSILEKTERMMEAHCPGTVKSAGDLLDTANVTTLLIARLLVVQSIAGRLGRWSVRGPEIPDARTARSLFKDFSEPRYSQYRALLQASEELRRSARHKEAAAALLDADRLVRTAKGLLQAASSLTLAGDYVSALWCARATLLEPRASFESQDDILRAHHLEGRLRAIIEGRSTVPLNTDEARIIHRDDSEGFEVVREESIAPEAADAAGLASGWGERRVATMPPSLRHRALLRAERETETTEHAFEVPKPRQEDLPTVVGSAPTRLTSRPPIAQRNNTLPPHPIHRALVEAEREKAREPVPRTSSDDERLARQIERVDPFSREETVAAEALRVLHEFDALQLVSATFDLHLDLVPGPPPPQIDNLTEEEWVPVVLADELSAGDRHAFPLVEESTEVPPERPRARGVPDDIAVAALESERATEMESGIVVISAEDPRDDEPTFHVSAQNLVTEKIRVRARRPHSVV